MYSSRFGMYSSRFGMYSTRFGMDPADLERHSTDGDFGMYLTDSDIGMYSSDGETTCPGAEESPITATTAASSSTGADGVDSTATTPPTVASPSMTTTTTTAPPPEAAPAVFQAYTEAVAAYERRAPAPSVRLVPVRFLVLQTTSRLGGPPASATHRRYLAVAGVQPVTRVQLLAVLQGLLDAIPVPPPPPPSTSPSSSSAAAAAAAVTDIGVPHRRRRLTLADVTLHGAAAGPGGPGGPGDITPHGLADFADDGLAWELRAMAEERERAMAAAPHRRTGAGVGDACRIDVVVDDTV